MKLKDITHIEGPWSIYLFAFLIPLNPKWYGFALILLALESIFRFRSIRGTIELRKIVSYKNPIFWLSVFYLIHVLGIWNTTNMDFASMDLGMKSTFIIIPVYSVIFKPKVNLLKLFHFFSIGAIVSFVIYLIAALANYFESYQMNSFYGPTFSIWMHRGYYASYLVIAVSYFLYRLLNDKRGFNLYLLASIILSLAIILTESKIGVILLLFNLFVFLFLFLKNVIGMLKTSIVLISSLLLLFLAFVYLTPQSSRFAGIINFNQKEKLDVNSVESTTARIFMWETSSDLIKENLVLGVGTGDVKDELQKLNYKKGYIGVADNNLNSHNQFLNSWVALGIFGFLALFFVFISSIPKKDSSVKLLVYLVLIAFFVSFLTESFLEVQAGIIPFAFLFSCIGLAKK